MLGLLDVTDPVSLQTAFDDLRSRLVNDPYFKDVPSIQASGRKTALAFHAHADLPEVRKEVFALLRELSGLRFFAVVTDKMSVLEYVRQQNERIPAYRYQPNELYDYLVRRLFKDRLHQDSGYEIMFSKRGAQNRTAALQTALEIARERFARRWGIQSNAALSVIAQTPPQNGGLQAVDYFLWSLQRFYERREDRYLEFLWPQFSLVQDLDDKRERPYGCYYTQKEPLTLAALDKGLPADIG